jgi:hypothetical protein
MNGTLPLLLLYGFMAWTGTALFLPFIMCFIIFRDLLQAIVDTTKNQTMHLHLVLHLCSSMLKLALELL